MRTSGEVEAALRKLFVDQHGVVSACQVCDAGMSRKAVRHRLESGVGWHCITGVYADAVVPSSWHQRVMAGLLAAGPAALVSHRTALQLWGVESIDERAPIEITTVLERDPRIAGLLDTPERAPRRRRDAHVHCGIPVDDRRARRSTSSRVVSRSPRLGRLDRRRRPPPSDDVRTHRGLLRAAARKHPDAARTRCATCSRRGSKSSAFVSPGSRSSCSSHCNDTTSRSPRRKSGSSSRADARRLDKCYAAAKLVLESRRLRSALVSPRVRRRPCAQQRAPARRVPGRCTSPASSPTTKSLAPSPPPLG